MAFGVKWNQTGEDSGPQCAERRDSRRGRLGPRADPAPGAPGERGRRTPRPEPPSSSSAPDRTGRGRRGRDGAVSHFPLQSKTHRHAPGTPAPRPTQPRARARAQPATEQGSGEAPGPARGPPREEARALAHPLPCPPLRASCWPRKGASPRHGRLLTARHRLLLRTGTRGGGWRQGTAGLGLRKGPTLGTSQARGHGRKSLSTGCGERAGSCGRENEGAAHGRRNSLLPAPALQQRWRWPRPPPSFSSPAGSGPFPPFSPQAGALAELTRGPGGALLLRHLLRQRRLHLPLVTASVPATCPAALPRLAARSRR